MNGLVRRKMQFANFWPKFCYFGYFLRVTLRRAALLMLHFDAPMFAGTFAIARKRRKQIQVLLSFLSVRPLQQDPIL